MSEPIFLTMPFPDMRLSPNKKSHWTVKMSATREARTVAKLLATEQCKRNEPIKYADVLISWYPPDNRRRDYELLLRATKPIIDGIVDAGVLEDDSCKVIRVMTINVEPFDRINPRTVIAIFDNKR